MTVTAELNAGSRSVISYFLYPLTRGLDESLREP
jgi:HlyD family secretion protein